MNLYIWHDANNATEYYLDNGGILAFGATLDEARQNIADDDSVPKACDALTTDPDLIVPVVAVPEGAPLVTVHPNAGCC